MGGSSFKEVKQLKADSFTDAGLTDESFSLLKFHMGSGIGGVLLILGVMAFGGAGYALARLCAKRKALARRAATKLEEPGKQTTQ